jgi:microcystin-dependent protein
MAEPFLGEIRMCSFNFAPKGWALCDGALLQINLNQALFALLGTTYGGNGTLNFALPNLKGRVPIHMGTGFTLGQTGGEATHTLNISELAGHTHTVQASSTDANQTSPSGNLWANGNVPAYSGTGGAAMNAASISSAGGGSAHDNMSPYRVINFVIALQGIFPTFN